MLKFNFLIFPNVLGSRVTGTPYCQYSTFPRDKHQRLCWFCATVYQWLAHGDTQDKNVTIWDKRKGSQWPCLPPGGAVSSDESCSPRGFLPLSKIKAFGLNIFQSLNTLIFIFFFSSRQFRKGNRRSFIYFKLENLQRENPKGHPTTRLPQGGSVPDRPFYF